MAYIHQTVKLKSQRGHASGQGGKQDTEVPSQPSLTADAQGSASSIYLSCTAATDNVGVTAYKFERSLTGASPQAAPETSGWTLIRSSTDRFYLDTGRSAATEYFYRVRAYDAAGNYSSAGTANATTSSLPVSENAIINTTFTGIALQDLASVSLIGDALIGTDSNTGFVFSATSPYSPRMWGGEWVRPYLHHIPNKSWWNTRIVAGAGPGGGLFFAIPDCFRTIQLMFPRSRMKSRHRVAR